MPKPRLTALAAAVLAATAALAACAPATSVVDAAPADAVPPEPVRTPEAGRGAEPSGTPELPDGWRWESYRDVQVAVPGDWSWINGSQRTYQWCVGDDKVTGIGRPGGSTLVGCGRGGDDIDPGSRISVNGTFVAFGRADIGEPGTVGDRTSVTVGSVAVQVQADPGLREEILATVHRITVDANGCPVRDEVTASPGLQPSPAVALADLTGVGSVAACVYDLDEDDFKPKVRRIEGPSLSSSIRITGDAAAVALAGLAGAPAAGGQDRPEGCLYKYGGEMLVLLVESAAGPSRIHIRYSGCDHNAVDDGVSSRRLTSAVRPFVSGGNRPGGMSGGPGKTEAFFDVGPDGRVAPPTAPPS